MPTIRIWDLEEHILVVHLKDLIRLLAPDSLTATWTVSTVKSSESKLEWFEAVGVGGEQLEMMAQTDATISGLRLAAFAEDTDQIIWGEFRCSYVKDPGRTWLTIRVVDSTFYEIETQDKAVLRRIASTYDDVRPF